MTEIFLDTANIDEIKEILKWNVITGVTTNQKIFLKEKGCNFEERAKEILTLAYPMPVSLEGPNSYDGIIDFVKSTQNWQDKDGCVFDNIVYKIPMLGNGDGLRVVKRLNNLGLKTNVTACMTVNQACLAILAGATYVSLFYNRMKDWKTTVYLKQNSESGKKIDTLIADECQELAYVYAQNTISTVQEFIHDSMYNTKLIIGSIRDVKDVEDLIQLKPDIITIPTSFVKQMPFCEMTECTLTEFEKAWEEFCK